MNERTGTLYVRETISLVFSTNTLATWFEIPIVSYWHLRQSYQKDPEHFDIARWVAGTQPRDDLTLLFGIIGADGFVKLSSIGTPPSTLYVGDREYFKVQRDASTDQLYISAPLTGNVTKKLKIEFARRLSRPDGSFDGIVASSLDVSQLEKFFSSLDIGHDGIVSLVGYDGVIRAQGGPDPQTRKFAGTVSRRLAVISGLARTIRPASYWNYADRQYAARGVRRLISYRAISGFPLIAVVGLAKQEVFEQANATLRKYVRRRGHAKCHRADGDGLGRLSAGANISDHSRAAALQAIIRAIQSLVAHCTEEHGPRPVHVRSRPASRHVQRTVRRDVWSH